MTRLEVPGLPEPSLVEARTVFLSAIGLLISIGLVAQFRSYVGPDIGFLLDEAARTVNGERLYVDLVDMNPPMIVILNMAAVLLARHVGISDILVYRLGCSAVLLTVLWVAHLVLCRLLPGQRALRRTVLLLLTFSLFNLVGKDFGEREHLLLALILPYLLLAAARDTGREIPTYLSFISGLLAAGAFALKPHFALLWLAVETRLRLTGRIERDSLLPETVVIGGSLAVYAVATLMWAPGYLEMIGLLAASYSEFVRIPFWELFLWGDGALFTVFALLALGALGRHAIHAELLVALGLGALVCLVGAAIQQKGFSYHFYPAFALSTVLLGVIVLNAGARPARCVTRLYRVISVSLLVTVVGTGLVRNAVAAIRPSPDLSQVHMEGLLPVVGARAVGERIYVMAYSIASAYPLINYAGATSASRFAHLWLLPAVYMDQLNGDLPLRYRTFEEMGHSERYLNQAVFEDLRDHRPKLLIVLQHARDLPANGFRRLDYVTYFSRDRRIAAVLKRYQLVDEVGGFLVYERITDGADRSGPPPTIARGGLDVVHGPNVGVISAPILDREFQLSLIAFTITAVAAMFAERSRARVAASSA